MAGGNASCCWVSFCQSWQKLWFWLIFRVTGRRISIPGPGLTVGYPGTRVPVANPSKITSFDANSLSRRHTNLGLYVYLCYNVHFHSDDNVTDCITHACSKCGDIHTSSCVMLCTSALFLYSKIRARSSKIPRIVKTYPMSANLLSFINSSFDHSNLAHSEVYVECQRIMSAHYTYLLYTLNYPTHMLYRLERLVHVSKTKRHVPAVGRRR